LNRLSENQNIGQFNSFIGGSISFYVYCKDFP